MKVKFNGASNDQANFGSGKDPRDYLKVEEVYKVVKTDVYKWHTLYYIWASVSKMDKCKLIPFNSVCFTAVG